MASRSNVPGRSDAVLASARLVGRDDVFASLCEAVRAGARTVLLEGEAGVGKSRLVAELQALVERDGMRVRTGYCQPHRDPLPLLPVVEAVRDVGLLLGSLRLTPLVGALRPVLPELADRLPPMPEPLGDPHAERYRVFRALREVLAALGPTALVVEDLHWVDGMTGELLRFLAADVPGNLSLVLTYRDEDLPADSELRSIAVRRSGTSVVRLRLDPLSSDEVREMVRDMLGLEQVSAEFATYVHGRTEGLPFAVEEVLRLLVDRRDLVWRDGAWGRHELDRLDVPDAIRDAIVERVGRLSAPARAVVFACAVAAEPVTEGLLCRVGVLPPDGGLDVLREALRSGLLVETDDGRIGFRHVLAREAAYGAGSGPERRQLHLRVARALEESGDRAPARLAEHFRAAQAWTEWARYAEAAADEAARRYDERTACRLVVDVMTAVPLEAVDRIRMARKLGLWALEGSAAGAVADLLGAVLADEELDPEVRGELRYGRARALAPVQRLPEAYDEWRLAVPDLAGRPDLAARAMSCLGIPWVEDVHVDEHRRWLDQALTASESASSSVCRLMVRDDHATALLLMGDPRARAVLDALPRDVERVDERRELVRGLCNLTEGALVVGHYTLAEGLLQRAGALDDQAQDRLVRAVARHHALLAWFTGRWDEAGGDPLLAALVGQARGADGSLADELAELARALRRNGYLAVSAIASAGLARCLLAKGQVDGARAVAAEALDVVRRKGVWAWAADVAGAAVGAALVAGAADEARDVAAELAAGCRQIDAPACVAASDWCDGLVAEAADDRGLAAERFTAAYHAWEAMPRPYDAALARERMGMVLLDVEEERAYVSLIGALETFQRLGAVPPVARLTRVLRERKVVLPARLRPRQRRFGVVLSTREGEVAYLAARGRTNREIAEALGLSPRTVAHHLERAMRKLNVSSRTHLDVDAHGGVGVVSGA